MSFSPAAAGDGEGGGGGTIFLGSTVNGVLIVLIV